MSRTSRPCQKLYAAWLRLDFRRKLSLDRFAAGQLTSQPQAAALGLRAAASRLHPARCHMSSALGRSECTIYNDDSLPARKVDGPTKMCFLGRRTLAAPKKIFKTRHERSVLRMLSFVKIDDRVSRLLGVGSKILSHRGPNCAHLRRPLLLAGSFKSSAGSTARTAASFPTILRLA